MASADLALGCPAPAGAGLPAGGEDHEREGEEDGEDSESITHECD
jgi:hypothetical protein